MSQTIHLVRHGAVANPQGVIYGRRPGFHLSDRGVAQAREAADHLEGRAVTAVLTSPLERAQETAEEIARRHGVSPEVDPRLIESGTNLEGVTRTLIGIVADPRNWWRLRNPFKPSWGESFSDIKERMVAAISDARERWSDGELVFVSHQGPVVAAWGAFTGRRRPPWTAYDRCPTGTVITIELEEARATSYEFFHPAI